ncbi:uncharacterized protein GGS25DRAFT_138795 [Hypoxylon fragiforme]|uniref:uncharacterized protein n=1 Tax=Hypoxylon fragiforme TaxID=63214 RepID=UPI0020C5EC38|nr:uncharacterized protein GGS25DRAFT_138795 [Hypoxylon fragiforme]KAI2612864.1 hypothetical protein GGS25DRAFT_138795 [Hypoxylon fragiforme]
MATCEPRDSGVSLTPFFDRCKLPPIVQNDCDAYVKLKYSEPTRTASFQGYCSYTVFVGEQTVVQFRPLAHKLDVEISNTACEIFGSLAPETECLGELEGTGLYIYSMRRIPGVSLADFRAKVDFLQVRSQRELIVRDFAHLQATAWDHAISHENISRRRTVGSSIRWRLELMANNLPLRFRRIAKSILLDLPEIEALPWTLSHGDFLPSNIIVNPTSGKLSGLIDWTEGEFLPFGIGMYGLQELLGEDRGGHFVFYPDARQLRRLFWSELLASLPDLARKPKTVALVKKAQILGILLWHGIAFDNGKLDRAVEEGKDDGEIERLDAFLLSPLMTGTRKLRAVRPRIEAPFSFLRGLVFGKA